MTTIRKKELRNNVADVLRRAEAGELFTITLPGGRSRNSARPPGGSGSGAWTSSASFKLPRRRRWPTISRSPCRARGSLRVSRVLLDTSVLIGAVDPGELEGAISVASLAALHFGTLVAGEPDEQARRAQRQCIPGERKSYAESDTDR